MTDNQPLTNVRFAPNSGHKWLWRWMSAYDPKRTLMKAATRKTLIALYGHPRGLGPEKSPATRTGLIFEVYATKKKTGVIADHPLTGR